MVNQTRLTEHDSILSHLNTISVNVIVSSVKKGQTKTELPFSVKKETYFILPSPIVQKGDTNLLTTPPFCLLIFNTLFYSNLYLPDILQSHTTKLCDLLSFSNMCTNVNFF